VTLAVFFLYLRHSRPAAGTGKLTEIAAFVMILLAFFTKGPVGLVLPVGIWSTFLLCEKKWRTLLSFTVKSFLLAAFGIGIELLFLWNSGGSELIQKVFSAQLAGRVGVGANGPVYYYLLYLLSGAAPWWIPACFGFFLAVRQGAAGVNVRTFMSNFFPHEIMRLAACWFFFVFVLFTAASTRHSRYLLPLFPALFLLIGRGIELFWEQMSLPRKQGTATFFRYFFFLIVAAGTVMYVAAPLSYRPPILFWLVWSACSILIYVLLTKKTGKNSQAFGLALLCVGCAMAAEAMLVEPWISYQESGRLFVRETEAKIDQTIPIVFYKISPDGDGIKYALHSSRRSETLSFTGDSAEINRLPLPFVLVSFAKSEQELTKFGNEKSMEEIAQGLLHKKIIKSWLIRDMKQDIPQGETLSGLPATVNGI
ncbi:MAG: hypothetical protein KJ717_05880, partial [Proteobacteria bacterium]|nr:hypothetical protein [Pseudomonadota bacterium]